MAAFALSVRCWECGHLHELGDRNKLSHAHGYKLPIFPRRCRQCGIPFSPASIEYLKEFAFRFMLQSKAAELETLEVRMVPTYRLGPR